MGNTASEIITKVSGASSEEMQKLLTADIELLQDPEVVFSSAKLSLRSDLKNYIVPGQAEKSEKKDLIPTEDEQSLICSQDYPLSAKERHEVVVNNLMTNITRNLEPDIASSEVTKRLQAFYRVFEAILRADELKKKKSKQEVKGDQEQVTLPATARSAIKFGLNTLLCLVECVASINPRIYELVVNDADQILSEMGPLAMLASDSTLTQAFSDIAKFFDNVIEGRIHGISQESAMKSFSPLFRLALSTGSVELLVTFACRLLKVQHGEALVNALYPALKEYSAIKPRSNLLRWDSQKKNDLLVLREENMIVANNCPNLGCVFSTGSFASERFYFEILVNKACNGTHFGICEASYNNNTSWSISSHFTATYESTNAVYLRSNSQFNFEPWKDGDKIGMFVDMIGKKVWFYKNGVKQTGAELAISCDEVRVYMAITGPAEFTIVNQTIYPEDIKALLLPSAPQPLPLTEEFSNEKPSEAFLSQGLGEVSYFIISKIAELIEPYEYLFESKTFRFTSQSPVLGLQLTRNTMESLYNFESAIIQALESKSFSIISESSSLKSLASTQKLIRYHLRLAKDTEDNSIDSSLKQSVLDLAVKTIKDFPEGPSSEQAALIISSSFEVFYKDPTDKLRYIIDSLQRFVDKQEVLPVFKDMEQQIYKEMARADKLFPALNINSDDDGLIVTRFYKLLIDTAKDISKNCLEGQKTNNSVIKLLEAAQTVILAQAGRAQFKDPWKKIVIEYTKYLMQACEEILLIILSLCKGSKLPEESLKAVEKSIVSRPVEELLNALVLSPMDIEIVAEVLPLVNNMSEKLGKISASPPILTLGLGIIEETYESAHNYPDGANLTHTIKIPNAVKYNLTFDTQCKTENGCDYLELWLDEAATNKHARWEGESFPKEPVDVVNPILHFTFHSDGSVNYWGWKITIKASVESNFYAKQWPDTTKDTLELFYGFCASKLISGKFDATETPEDVQNVLQNLLLKYGLNDKCTLLSKPLASISPEFEKIIEGHLSPVSSIVNGQLEELLFVNTKQTGLGKYLDNYKTLTTPQFADSGFLVELVDGGDKIVKSWAELKKKSGIFGAGSTIGGADLDQAERAVFAVYVGFFEIVDTMKHIFESVNEAGPTVKIIIKQSCQIRSWAQKHKQKLMDGGNADITYKIINDDVVKKCSFLLAAEYQASLKELGVTKVMKNLMSSIAKAQVKKGGLKLGSKWKAVQEAMKSVGKLKGLVSIKNKVNEGENEDIKEFMRVADLVTGFLENPVTIDQITEALQIRRTKAIARVVGLLSVSRLLQCSGDKHATLVVNSFSNSFKQGEKKLYHSFGLEGTDPALLESVRQAFFIVYKSLLSDIISNHTSVFTYETYVHYSNVIEALSCPLRNTDSHLLLDLPLTGTLKVLLDWSQGLYREKASKREFLKAHCVTRFGLLTEDAIGEGKLKILIEKREGQPSLYMVVDKGGNEDPITEVLLSEEVKEGWEDAVGSFTFNGEQKFLLIKREPVSIYLSYVTNLAEDLTATATPYGELLAPINEEENKKITALKEKLSKSAWNLYKHLLFSVVGMWNETNHSQHIQLQQKFLDVIFPEIVPLPEVTDQEAGDFSLENLSSGNTWLNSNLSIFNQQSKMKRWLIKFTEENPPRDLQVLISSYVEAVDNLKIGKVPNIENNDFQEKLKLCQDQDGAYSFWKFLEVVKENSKENDEVTEYINNSKLWKEPVEEGQGKYGVYKKSLVQKKKWVLKECVEEILQSLETTMVPAEEKSFAVYLDLFKAHEGVVKNSKIPENTPEEFQLNSELDMFKTLNAILTTYKYPHYAKQLEKFFSLHPELPKSFGNLSELKAKKRDFISSLLWTLYGAFTSTTLSSLLSRDIYLRPLLYYTFASPTQSLQTICTRLLARILPNQHSPQSFAHIWNDFSTQLPQDDRVDFITLLLKRIGKSAWPCENYKPAYESHNLLLALLNSDRWKQEIIGKVQNSLSECGEFLDQNKLIKAVHAGAIKFLSFSDGYGVTPFVLAVVDLKDSNFSTGIIKEVVDEKTYFVYSVIDDAKIKVDVNNIVAIQPPGALKLAELIKDQSGELCEKLVQTWLALNRSTQKAISVGFEAGATMKAIYLSLEISALNGLSTLISSTTDLALLEPLVADLLAIIKKSTVPTKTLYNKVIKETSKKLQELYNEPEEFTAKEVEEKVAAMSEEEKTKFNEIVAAGSGPVWVYKCFSKGIKELEAVRAYVEEIAPLQVYKLGPVDEYSIDDVHGSAEIYQNHLYQIVMYDSLQAKKEYKFSAPKTLFHNNKYFVTDVTIRAVIEGVALDGELEYGFSVGDVSVLINQGEVWVNGFSIGKTPASESLVLRINAKSSGKAWIAIENSNLEYETSQNTVFTGYSVGEFRLSLLKGSFAGLMFLEIFDGEVKTNHTGKIEKTKKPEGGERFVKIKKKTENASKSRIKLLGISDTQAEAALAETENLTDAILYSFNNFTPQLPEEAYKIPNECIVEVKLFEALDQVTGDFHVVNCLENFVKIDMQIPNRRVLAFKKAPITKDSKGLTSLAIIENNEGESLGDLSIGETDRPNPIFFKTIVLTQKDQPIRDIVYIKANSVHNVKVPSNYELITDKEGKAINLALKTEKDHYIFIAVCRSINILNTSVSLLENIPAKNTTFGLAESKKAAVAQNKDESLDYSVYSINELYSLVIDFEIARKSSAAFSLVSSILNKNSGLILGLSQKHSLSKILSFVDSKSLSNLVTKSIGQFNTKLVCECVNILVSSLVSKSGGRVLQSLAYESKHPYDNNMDLDDVIQIPGAKSLKIEFDPQCYTESGCDPLRFYERSGRQGEIKCLSGQGESSWQAFEVPGDTVYTYFHSDGSVNYWGYKFTVIPQGGSSASSDEDFLDTSSTLTILKALANSPEISSLINTDKFLCPLYVYLIACSAAEDKAKVLDIIRLLYSEKITSTHVNVLKSLSISANNLYNSTKAEKNSHNILQGIIMIMCQVLKLTNVKIEDPWFLDLSDLLSDMHGLTYKDNAIELFLFESYKSSGGAKLEKEFECAHPYPINTTTSLISIQGAHSLNIEFTKESKAEERHTVYFTTDAEGKHDIESESGFSTLTAKWEHKGPDITVDQDDKRATRTNSSNWGSVISDLKFSKGINSISFLIENTGDSGYLYIGLMEADENNTYELGTCLNSDYAKRVWTWRKSGEFHVKGSNVSGVGYETNDTITFVVNSLTKTIICYLNSVEIYSFSNIADTVVPVACFGGSNQFVIIKKVEAIGAATLEGKKLSVVGDSAYLWFPVNTSAKMSYKWDYSNDDNGTISFDKLTVAKIGENPTLFPTNVQVQWGRHYFQSKVNKTGKVAIGLATASSVTEKSFEDPKSILYVSEGTDNETYTSGDIIGCLADTEHNIVIFYKNSVEVFKLEGKLDQVAYQFVSIIYVAEQSITIVPGHPVELDLLKIESEQVSSEWGYKIKVSPEFKGRSQNAIQTFLSSSSEEFCVGWSQYRDKFAGSFKNITAEELVAYVDVLVAAKGKDPLTIGVEEIEPTEPELIYYPELEKMHKDDIKKLFKILQGFNKRIENSLYLFDLSISENITDMQKVLFGCRSFIFFKLKNEVFKKVLDKTKCETRTEINIDRPKAARHRLKKEIDTEAQFSIYGQIYRAMSAIENKDLRNSERIYKINYRGEASIDAGGPYNESMSNICDELQSSFLKLLVPVQNNVHNMGENRESWTISPSATTDIDYELYLFLGKLMGAAIRTQNNLNLSFPPLVWKKVLHEHVGIQDLRGMDVCAVQILEILKNPSAHELSRDNFEMAYDERFVTKDSSGKEIELFPGGKDKVVTYDNCGEYADLVAKKRLEENPKAYEKIRQGISAVVPVDYLNLFSWKQLETLVCGTVDVDVDILKENTDYEGCGLSDQHIQYFWEILKEFTQKERSLYLKFVWGRSRLPSGKDWRHMKITRYNPNGPVNNFMPVSHTCFFTLDLPAYTTKEAMRIKLLYAITHCTAIDLDGSAGAGWDEND